MRAPVDATSSGEIMPSRRHAFTAKTCLHGGVPSRRQYCSSSAPPFPAIIQKIDLSPSARPGAAVTGLPPPPAVNGGGSATATAVRSGPGRPRVCALAQLSAIIPIIPPSSPLDSPAELGRMTHGSLDGFADPRLGEAHMGAHQIDSLRVGRPPPREAGVPLFLVLGRSTTRSPQESQHCPPATRLRGEPLPPRRPRCGSRV